jgi:hypothetical protein
MLPSRRERAREKMAANEGASERPSEEELRERVEEQLRRVRVQDLMVESVAGILNLSARRVAKEDERDLEQARIGIEAVRALVGLLEPEPAKAVRDALSEVQVLYAREAGRAEAQEEKEGSEAEEAAPKPPPAGQQRPRREPPPRLWTPPGST